MDLPCTNYQQKGAQHARHADGFQLGDIGSQLSHEHGVAREAKMLGKAGSRV